MRVLFVHVESEITTNLGVMYPSSMLKSHGHSCKLLYSSDKWLLKGIKDYSPGLIAISCTSMCFRNALSAARRIKRDLDVPIILGGPHATFYPEVIEEECIDMICRGEGEHALLELADALEKRGNITRIRNIWVKEGGRVFRNDVRPLVDDLDTLPFPDRGLYKRIYRKMILMAFMSSRGCPYDCSFCFNHQMKRLYQGKGRYIRRRTVENIILEIKEVVNSHGIKRVKFTDDTFTLDRNWVIDFCRKYRREIGLPFDIQTRADLLDEVLVRKLKKAGCSQINIGIESGNERIRNLILKKGVSNDDIERAFSLFRKYGIKSNTFNMLGIPGETIDNVFQTIELNIKIRPSSSFFIEFQPYPKLELTEFALKHGYLRKDFLSFGYDVWETKIEKPDVVKALKFLAPLYIRLPFLYRFKRYMIGGAIARSKYAQLFLKLFHIYLLSRAKSHWYRSTLDVFRHGFPDAKKIAKEMSV